MFSIENFLEIQVYERCKMTINEQFLSLVLSGYADT